MPAVREVVHRSVTFAPRVSPLPPSPHARLAGQTVAAWLAAISIQVLDRATNQIVGTVPTGASPHHPLFTPDGKLGLSCTFAPRGPRGASERKGPPRESGWLGLK